MGRLWLWLGTIHGKIIHAKKSRITTYPKTLHFLLISNL
jgi:hypothetical protein